MKKLIFSALAIALLAASCGKDTEIEYRDVIVHDTVTVKEKETVEVEKITGYYTDNTPLLIQKGDTVIVNYGDINVGDAEKDVVYDMFSTVLTTGGKVTEHTLNCNALGALTLGTDEDGTPFQDMDKPVTNVTFVNRGTITVHTKDLVEKYKDLIQDPEHLDRKYKYFRVIVLFAGKQSKVVNEGVINVYFDHDPDNMSTIYVMGLVAGDGGEIINSGEIHFYGKGSMYTRMRGIGTFASNISIVNDGIITAEVDAAEDSRGITTGGTNTNVLNNGTIDFKLPGTVFGMTRYANNNLINNGTIKITALDAPEKYRLSSAKEVAGFYDPLNDQRQGPLPPMVNRGTVSIDIKGTEENGIFSGMLFDVMSGTADYLNTLDIHIENEGVITTSKPNGKIAAEAAFFSKTNKALAATITLGHWKTQLRDFANTKDLFLGMGLNINLGVSKLMLTAPDNYVSETAYGIGPNALFTAMPGYRCEVNNYKNMSVVSAESGKFEIVLDKENQTAALKTIPAQQPAK